MIVCGYCVNGAHLGGVNVCCIKEYLAFLLVLGLCSEFRLRAMGRGRERIFQVLFYYTLE